MQQSIKKRIVTYFAVDLQALFVTYFTSDHLVFRQLSDAAANHFLPSCIAYKLAINIDLIFFNK